MASQTRVQNLAGRYLRERDDRLLAALGVDVLLSGSVAPLATHVVRRDALGDVRFIVRVAEELQRDIGVTGAAGSASDEAAVRCGAVLCGLCLQNNAGKHNPNEKCQYSGSQKTH